MGSAHSNQALDQDKDIVSTDVSEVLSKLPSIFGPQPLLEHCAFLSKVLIFPIYCLLVQAISAFSILLLQVVLLSAMKSLPSAEIFAGSAVEFQLRKRSNCLFHHSPQSVHRRIQDREAKVLIALMIVHLLKNQCLGIMETIRDILLHQIFGHR